MNRRQFCGTAAGVSMGSIASILQAAQPAQRARMGIVIHSFPIRAASEPKGRLQDPLAFLEVCREFGAGGGQTSLGVRDKDYIGRVRAFLEKHAMYLEGSIRLPRDQKDAERFDAEVRTARECGATILRTVLLSGRRYEVFKAADDFRQFEERSRQSLTLARPIVEKHKVLLAIENHKDWRSDELIRLLRWLKSPSFGVCLDTGNSIALLETPQETLEALAPHTFTTHIKDMGVEEYADGFLLSEVPLGTGFLDLAAIFRRTRQARPEIRFNLEMITRDPLRIPCLTSGYWVTMENLTARTLANMLALVRSRKQTLPRISPLDAKQRLQREDDNVRQSLRFATQKLSA
ncbi:MAG: sugar phosphate isomerase/epimerase [Gemmataceae bacterium]|nr:sugar phosphate isomerase/epimerase [Gemmataceae bacterium]MCI0743688.1 sugar phosphate isomerase/epimerase [Gemmataceae bacterium]